MVRVTYRLLRPQRTKSWEFGKQTMQSKSPVEIADIYSRKRAIIVAAAAIVFLVGQLIVRPFTDGWPGSHHNPRSVVWAINAILLLACLATGGGLLNSRQIFRLVNDEVARANYRTAVAAGFWVAMITALGLYFLPSFEKFVAGGAIYIIVTVSIVVSLLAFSYLELRAHRNA